MSILDQLEELGKPTVHQQEWMLSKQFILATKDDIDTIVEECIASGVYGLDLETSGLDQRAFPTDSGRLVTNDKIVGYCIAPNTSKAYYVPVRHKDSDANVPPRVAADMINRIQAGGAKAVFHNAKFDQKFLMCEPAGDAGNWSEPSSWEDTLILAYLRNMRQKRKGLKFLAETELQRKMIELDELFPAEQVKKGYLDFSTLDPTWEPVVWYAASDALNTLSLYEILYPVVMQKDDFGNGQGTVYLIEKIALTATIWMEQCRIYIDQDKLLELIRTGQKEWWEAINEVYDEVSNMLERDIRPSWVSEMAKEFDPEIVDPSCFEVRNRCLRESAKEAQEFIPKSVPSLKDPKVMETVRFQTKYDVTIPAELGMLLRELGVRGLKATEKSGQVQTTKAVLEEVIGNSGSEYPWMKKVKKFREITKALGSNLFNIYNDLTRQHGDGLRSPDGCLWVNFNGTKLDTGRFSTPAAGRSEFFGQANWNVQSTPATYNDPDNPKPDCVWRMREIVAARPGYVMFAIDYSGVELRIVTNMSGEKKWLNEFFRCSSCDHTFERGETPPHFCPSCGSDKIGDLHSLTTLSLFGEEIKRDKDLFKLKRQTGKIVNFLLCYGGGGNAVARSVDDVDKEEGWRIKNQFDKTYTGLRNWWKSQHDFARKSQYVMTMFGRKYPVPDINHEYGSFRSKAERNSVNGPVQGSGADIMKLAMGLIEREVRKRGWVGKVLMNITIHDELVFEIHESVVGEAIPVIEHLMCVKTVENLNLVVPLKVDIEFGPNWSVPYNLTEMTWNNGVLHETNPDKKLKKQKKYLELWSQYHHMFPIQYAHYLECGGLPVETVLEANPIHVEPSVPAPVPTPVSPTATASVVQAQVAATPVSKPSPRKELLEQGGKRIFRISSNRLSPDLANALARVIIKTRGRGVDILYVQDENGHDLIGGPVRVAYEEFLVIANYEGL